MGTPSLKTMAARVRFIFALIFLIVGTVVLSFGGHSLYRAKTSTSWPSTEGHIQNSGVSSRRNNEGTRTYSADITYAFSVNGTTHTGTTVAFGDFSSSNPLYVQDIVNRYPRNKPVPVYYLATNPDICVLEPGIKRQAWFMPGIGFIFFLAGVLLAIFLRGNDVNKETTA